MSETTDNSQAGGRCAPALGSASSSFPLKSVRRCVLPSSLHRGTQFLPSGLNRGLGGQLSLEMGLETPAAWGRSKQVIHRINKTRELQCPPVLLVLPKKAEQPIPSHNPLISPRRLSRGDIMSTLKLNVQCGRHPSAGTFNHLQRNRPGPHLQEVIPCLAPIV